MKDKTTELPLYQTKEGHDVTITVGNAHFWIGMSWNSEEYRHGSYEDVCFHYEDYDFLIEQLKKVKRIINE